MANFLLRSEMVSPLTWVLKYEEEFARQKRREATTGKGISVYKGDSLTDRVCCRTGGSLGSYKVGSIGEI